MMRHVAIETRMADLGTLVAAHNADSLWRALVLRPPAAYKRDATLPLVYFKAAHRDDAEGAATTAMLLVTDPRSTVASSQIMSRIEETGIVPDDHLNLLAEMFVRAKPRMYGKCPDDWFDAELVIDLGPIGDDIERDEDEPDGESPKAVVARSVPDVLRRWGVTRLIRVDRGYWSGLLARAREIGGAEG
jgi:hypothetical protein